MRDFQALAKTEHPVEHGVKGLTGQVQRPGDDGQVRLDRPAVVHDDVRQNDRIGQAVMRVEMRSHGVRDGVHAPESLLKRGCTHAGRGQHARAGLEVLAVFAGARQIHLDQPHTLERYAVGQRVEPR